MDESQRVLRAADYRSR